MIEQNTTLTIRAFDASESGYEAIVKVHNACNPDALTSVDEWQALDQNRNPKHKRERLVAIIDGEVVGFVVYSIAHWSHQKGKFYLRVSVHPDRRCQGIGSQLYDEALKQIEQQNELTALTSSTHEHHKDSIRFLKRHGFKCVLREPISRLGVAAFDPTPYTETLQSVEESPIKIHSVADLQNRDPNCWQKLYELEWKILQDVPVSEPLVRSTYEDYLKRYSDERTGFNPNTWFIAVAPSSNDTIGDYVGMTQLWFALAAPQKLYTGLTGVAQEYRRQGLATALKIHAIQFAKDYGATEIETDNEENNPMFDLNVALGFREVSAYLSYDKTLKEA